MLTLSELSSKNWGTIMTTRYLPITTVFSLIILGLAQSCAWVELSKEGKTVTTTTAEKITSCKKLGAATVNTLHKVGFFNRDDYALRTELNDMARNEATKLGGNTLVPITKPEQGSQTFAVYRCP